MKPYFEQDGITIYHADCREVLPQLSGIDMVFTSPPYNKGVRFDGNWSGAPTTSSKGKRFRGGYGQYGDDLPMDVYEEQQREILKLCWKTLSRSGAIFYNHKPRVIHGKLWMPLILNPDLPLRQIVVWATGAGVNIMPGAYVPSHEWIMVFAKPGFRLATRADSAASDVWRIAPERSGMHPAPFPVGLPQRALETVKPNVVLDPFMGTGTTLLAARLAGIKAIGIEIEERYCEEAVKRLSAPRTLRMF